MEILRTIGLTKRFGEFFAVRNVSFSIKHLETTALIGPNGAGKTTLLNLITRRLNADAGRVIFNRRDITKEPPHKIVKLGLVRTFQIANIYPTLTVRENIMISSLALGGGDEVDKIIETLGLSKYRDRIVGKLPLGIQRLVEIGAALALKPKMLVMDEPTSGLGLEDKLRLLELLREIEKRTTIMIIEHDMDFVFNLAKRIIVMHRGEIIADGSPSEIADNKLVREIYLGE